MSEKVKKNGWRDFSEVKDMLRFQCEGIVSASLRFAEVSKDPDDDSIPWKWESELGKTEAKRVFRLAKAAWLPASQEPSGMKNAMRLLQTLIVDGRAATEKDVAPELKQSFVIMPRADAPEPKYGTVKHVDHKSDSET
jgi:hypothetical protein